jgi:hypothetical protein
VLAAWIAYSFGKARGTQHTWETAVTRARLVWLDGLCRGSSMVTTLAKERLEETNHFATAWILETEAQEAVQESVRINLSEEKLRAAHDAAVRLNRELRAVGSPSAGSVTLHDQLCSTGISPDRFRYLGSKP